MEGSALSFLKAEWKVSNTGSAHWASSFFYHHQKVIDHVHANHPFCCYYCDTTCTEFDNIIKQSVINHSLDVLKIKHLELNEKNGIYSYRSHNFNIIPRELDSTGKKIETDTPASTLRIHNVAVWLLFGQVPFLRENYVATTYFRYVICKSLWQRIFQRFCYVRIWSWC
jgi:hypothetical protein